MDPPGLAAERTSLAWGRSGLSIVAIAAALVKFSIEAGQEALGLAVAGLLLAAATVTWALGARADVAARAGDRRGLLRLVSAVTLFSAAGAFVLVLLS